MSSEYSIDVELSEPPPIEVTVTSTPVIALVSPIGTPGTPGPPGVANVVAVPYDEWPPADPQPDVLYLRLAP